MSARRQGAPRADASRRALAALRAGQGADLLMVDYDARHRRLIAATRPSASACRWSPAASAPMPPRAVARHPRRRQGIHPAAAGRRADRRACWPRSPTTTARWSCATRAWRACSRLADQWRPSDASILITGESGTGKEVMARYVHQQAGARRRPVHLGQLRRHPREPAGKRAVRPREGRLHRRRRPPHRQVRGSQRRHAAARRDQRDGRRACRPSCCAPCRSARSTASAARSR